MLLSVSLSVKCGLCFLCVWMYLCLQDACAASAPPPPPSAGPQRADGGVAQPGQRSNGGGGRVLLWERPGTSSRRPRAAAGASVQAGLAKATVHEAVDQWVDTGGGVAQQMDERDGSSREGPMRTRAVEGTPRVGAVHRQPTQEKEHNDDQQHPHHALLSQQLGLGGPGARSWCRGGRRQGRQLQGRPRPWQLHIAAVAVLA